jgi:TonB family protein
LEKIESAFLLPSVTLPWPHGRNCEAFHRETDLVTVSFMLYSFREMKTKLYLALTLVLLAEAAIADSKQAADELLRRAADSASPQAAMKGPYHVEYKLVFHGVPGGPLEGMYSLSWLSKDHWHREIAISDYSETAVSDGPSTWIARKPHLYQPHAVDGLLSDLESLVDLKLPPGQTVTKVKDESKDGLHLSCINAANTHVPVGVAYLTLCFNDSNGALVQITRGDARTEFSDFEDKGGGAFIARKIQHLHGKKLDAEAELTALTPEKTPAADLLEHPIDGREFPNCNGDLVSGRLVSREDPAYPLNARAARQAGTVKLYAVIDIDGSIRDMEVMQSVSKLLDDSAIEAVRKWRYQPYSCGGVPMRVETVVEIGFRL